MCLTISRLNHAYSPNAASTAGEVNGVDNIRAIAPNNERDEICISYRSDLCWIMTRAQRQSLLHSWNFDCQCSTYHRPQAEIELSDVHRKIIFALRWKTVFDEAVDLSHYDSSDFLVIEKAYDALNEPEHDQLDTISLGAITAYQVLLAHFLQAEGIECAMVGKAFCEAAITHFADLAAVKDNVLLLQWGVNVTSRMQKAIQITSDTSGPESTSAQRYPKDWEAMQLLPQFALLLELCDLPTAPTRPLAVQDLILQKY